MRVTPLSLAAASQSTRSDSKQRGSINIPPPPPLSNGHVHSHAEPSYAQLPGNETIGFNSEQTFLRCLCKAAVQTAPQRALFLSKHEKDCNVNTKSLKENIRPNDESQSIALR